MREVALCAKAQVIGDLGNRDAACQQALRLANTNALKIGMGRDTHFLFKDAEQITGTLAPNHAHWDTRFLGKPLPIWGIGMERCK